ncbi:helix-turn-helix domain-containing protein [Pseudomonas monteilii]|uniref:helix-turn-helix domain-containing protein n=1 Tax=Pseudomonas monteilii TaxID=76759 RepID=UPI001CC0B381|nr:helix-turn-helix transcriptional regulator [Pseudomonas monteilii]MBZ3666648.1 helix-turn-helix transcriptional regulator [Pseudomonas monteilii]MBZ3671973.1 helix-turn-helix transcriptional regulator [Pseudomonas monteilii]
MKGTFAETLARLRAEKGLTQRQLGSSAGVAWSMISKYESGQSTPRLKILMRLAEALGVSVEELQGQAPESRTVTLILEEPGGDDMPLTIDRSALELLQKAAEETGKPLGEIVSDTLLWGLQMIKSSPQFAESLKRQIEESRKIENEK